MTDDKPRFTDNNDDTITDNLTGLMWAKEDSWQMEARWLSWDEAREYTHNMAYQQLAGYNDWRLPEKEEMLILVDPDHSIQDKYGKDMKMNPVFPNGPLATVWTADGIGSDGYIVNFTTGKADTLYKSKSGRMAVRAVRGTKMSERPTQR
ncbi:MAG: DUF1566 domain-containing protein [Nitrospinaceae bacterium]|jgi:hypothetical protein